MEVIILGLINLFAGSILSAGIDKLISEEGSIEARIKNCYENACKIFEEKFGKDYDEVLDSFVNWDENQQVVINYILFPTNANILDLLKRDGFRNEHSASDEEISFFIETLKQEISKDYEICKIIRDEEFKKIFIEYFRRIEDRIAAIEDCLKKLKLKGESQSDIGNTAQDINLDVRFRCISRLISNGIEKDDANNLLDYDIENLDLMWALPDEDKRFIIIQGDYGAGKSYSTEVLFLQLINKYANTEDVFPIYFKISDITNIINDIEGRIRESKDININNSKILVFIDGLDETSYKKAEYVINEVRFLTIKYKNISFVITTRPISLVQNLDELKKIDPITEVKICELLSRIVGHDFTVQFLRTLDKETRETISRPFFTILLGVYLKQKGTYYKLGNCAMKMHLIDNFISNIFSGDNDLRTDFILLSKLSIECLNSGVHVSQIQFRSNINDILKTGLLEYNFHHKTFKFAIPVIAQWLSAEALYLGIKEIDEIITDVDEVLKWRYPLSFILYRYDHTCAEKIIDPIIKNFPGVMAQLFENGSDDSSSLNCPQTYICDTLIKSNIDKWKIGLKDSNGIFFSNSFDIKTEIYDDYLLIKYGENFGIPFQENSTTTGIKITNDTWFYKAAFGIVKNQLEKILKCRFIVNGTDMLTEYIWEASCKLLNKGSLYHQPIAIDSILKFENYRDGNTIVSNARGIDFALFFEQIDILVEKGVKEIIPPWPFSDLNPSNTKPTYVWDFYSSDRLLEKTQSVYNSALKDYKIIVDEFFRGFNNALSHYQMMPFTIKGYLMKSVNGSPSLTHYPIIQPDGTMSNTDIVLSDIENDVFNNDEIFKKIDTDIRNYRMGKTEIISQSIHRTSLDIFRFDPVTKIVNDWLVDDFKKLKWIT